VIVDVASRDVLRGIEDDCAANGWLFSIGNSVAADE
jgi:hypothetical protein